MHKAVQPAMCRDNIGARTQHQVERVGQNDLGADVDKIARRHRFHGCRSTDRHEGRGIDHTAR